MQAIIGGTSLFGSRIFSGWSDKKVKTPFGTVAVKAKGKTVFLQRHGSPPLPPHRIDHRANIAALKKLGVEKILAVNSVGSLKTAIKPGSLAIPGDFISPWHIPTFHDDDMRFLIPSMDEDLAGKVFKICREHTKAVRMGVVYVQTLGPRLETKAEINMLRRFGDIIGMTLASEATLAIEQAIPYASICSIDNYCNGIAKVPLTMDKIFENVSKNAKTIEDILDHFITKGLP